MKERDLLDLFKGEGKKFSELLHDENKYYFDKLGASYFAIAASISLTWTKHAQNEEEFIDYASNYIDNKIKYNPDIARKYALRFGIEQLDNALNNYQIYYSAVQNLMPDFAICDANQINKLQQVLLNKLNQLRVEKRVSHIGTWLFTGPFKIILSDQDRLWDQESINSIVLPTGFEVDKGISKLVENKYTFMKGFDSNWLIQETNSLIENYATYNMVHTYIEKLGQLTKTPAIHINSALYLYGKGDI